MKVRSEVLAFLIAFLLILCLSVSAQTPKKDQAPGGADAGPHENPIPPPPASLPELGISPLQLAFPSQWITTSSAAQMITLTNKGRQAIRIDHIDVSGDFSLAPTTFPLNLEPAAIKVLFVSFAPKHEGTAAGILTIAGNASGGLQNVALSGEAGLLPWLCSASQLEEVALIAILCLAYWLAMVIVRWNRIARPTRELLRAEIKSLRVELETLYSQDTRLTKVRGLLDDAEGLIGRAKGFVGYRIGLADFIFWSRGQEMTGWGYVHEAKIQAAQFLPEPTLSARLASAEQQLRLAGDAPSLALANTIHEALKGTAPAGLGERQALLAAALAANYQRDDDSYTDLVSWQNKTSWLVGCGLVLILVLTGVIQHHSILFLVGGLGGLLSRLSRSLNRKDVPTDYGASWTTLFLSPVAGALGAWTGILLAALAVKLNVLGPAFTGDWANPCGTMTLAIALVFGFSERLLDSVLDKIEAKSGVDPTTTSTKTTSPPQNTTANGAAAGGTLAIPEPSLPDGTVGTQYTGKLTATKGNVQWSLTQGILPPGLTLGSDGTISGTPTSAGPFKFTVAAAADQGSPAAREVTITIK
ncbi:MAG TPA: putative Ig domain-containing protein [Thermoanaerobaculia bacterium]|jgi:hypothetical protein|nr:putative Ig domain-containing protein [Thermoanaerobaculia bacterium]